MKENLMETRHVRDMTDAEYRAARADLVRTVRPAPAASAPPAPAPVPDIVTGTTSVAASAPAPAPMSGNGRRAKDMGDAEYATARAALIRQSRPVGWHGLR
jgi:hypothetical protein